MMVLHAAWQAECRIQLVQTYETHIITTWQVVIGPAIFDSITSTVDMLHELL